LLRLSCRLDIQEDTKIPNAATVKVLKQDHTLANMLRACVGPWAAARSCSTSCASSVNPAGADPPGLSVAGALLRLCRQLLCNTEVLFAGYRAPHPLEPHFLLKIQTTPQSTPILALRKASFELLLSIDNLKQQVAKERERLKFDAAAGGAGVATADDMAEPAGWSFAGTQGASQGAGWGLGGDMDF
jgi:DNA-directed RNA polymerase II subunit RPB11